MKSVEAQAPKLTEGGWMMLAAAWESGRKHSGLLKVEAKRRIKSSVS